MGRLVFVLSAAGEAVPAAPADVAGVPAGVGLTESGASEFAPGAGLGCSVSAASSPATELSIGYFHGNAGNGGPRLELGGESGGEPPRWR